MSRKTKTAPKTAPKTAIEDNFVAPKRKPAPKAVTLAEALAESGETLEELVAPAADEPKPERVVGTSNLAATIRNHRKNYVPMLHPNGKKTQNNGDEVAVLLLHVPLAALKDYAGLRFDGKRYDHLNLGHARMCIGNLMRGCVKKGEVDVLEWLMANQPKVEEAEAA